MNVPILFVCFFLGSKADLTPVSTIAKSKHCEVAASSIEYISDARIIGGSLARAAEFPWHTAIYKTTPTGKYFCAGSLIAANWILTAAQCLQDATELVLHLGSTELDSVDANRGTAATENYIMHENWNSSTLWMDIGLVKLREPIELSPYIQPIDFANFGYLYPGREVVAVGWGQTSNSGELVNELRYVDVAIIDQHECAAVYGDALFGSMVCTAGNYNEGICFGDVGGALVTPVHAWIGNHSIAVGVASWTSSTGCESVDPNGWTRLDTYFEWITQTMQSN